MKREIPILITLVVGVYMLLGFFVPHPAIATLYGDLQQWAIVVVGCTYVLGVANLLRINRQKVSRITFSLAIAAAGLGGVAMAMMYSFDPPVHNFWLIYVFLVVIVGGVGSILGTALAGLILGVITGLCMAFMPYQWINVLTFGLLIVVLLVRPQGLFKTGV